MPHLRNPHFTGREALLEALGATATDAQPLVLTQVLRGLGGIGKTQLALEYAYRYGGTYRLIWWVRAEEPETLASDYAALAAPLNLPQQAAQDQQETIAAVRQWLEYHEGWLLILDNAPEPSAVHAYLPRSPYGHLIITSRHFGWGGTARSLTVPVLPRTEAVELLLKAAPQADSEAVGAIAETLGDLPLALAQATAYIEATGLSLPAYLDRLQTRLAELLSRGEVGPAYPDTVATTWELAFEALQETQPDAIALLKLCAFFAPDDIPHDLLRSHPALLPEALGRVVADDLQWDAALSALRSYALIEVGEATLGVHRLVQAVARDRLPTQDRLVWVKAALQMVDAVFPGEVLTEPQTWAKCERLLPHALAATAHAEALDADAETTARLLNQTGLYFIARAQYRHAQGLVERSLAIRKAVFGAEHPETAQSLNNLGTLLQVQGDLDGARLYLERALVIREQVLGAEDLETAISLNNLGGLLQAQGDLDGAKPYFERALKIYEAVAGAEHPDTAQSLNSLGTLLRAQGDLDGARLCFERALFIRKAFYGAKHPETAQSLNSLGSVLQDQGKLAGARSYFEQALCIFRNCLGETHPWTQTVHRNLDSLDALEAAE